MKNRLILLTGISILISLYQPNFTMTLNSIKQKLQNAEAQLQQDLNYQQITSLDTELVSLLKNLNTIQNKNPIDGTEYRSLFNKIQELQIKLTDKIPLEKENSPLNEIEENLDRIQQQLLSNLNREQLDNVEIELNNVVDRIINIKKTLSENNRTELSNRIRNLSTAIIEQRRGQQREEVSFYEQVKTELKKIEKVIARYDIGLEVFKQQKQILKEKEQEIAEAFKNKLLTIKEFHELNDQIKEIKLSILINSLNKAMAIESRQ